jgi:hypothetical protein
MTNTEAIKAHIWAIFGRHSGETDIFWRAYEAGNDWLEATHPAFAKWLQDHGQTVPATGASRLSILETEIGWKTFGPEFMDMVEWVATWINGEEGIQVDEDLMMAGIQAAAEESRTFLCDPEGE